MTSEERQKRIHYHMYETCEGIAEHAERIVALEELCADMSNCITYNHDCTDCTINGEKCDASVFVCRMDELGVPH